MKTANINLDGRNQLAVNVSAVVGFGGANRRSDVMLIQGLFNYVYQNVNGLGIEYKIPEITGEMDADTYSAIGAFQIRNAGSLLMDKFDGRIHPASYANRRLHTGAGKRFMSITYLHLLATDTAVLNGQMDYIQELGKLNYELRQYIDLSVLGNEM